MKFKQDIESLTLIPEGGGVFEIFLDQELIYSKKATGEFPEPDSIVHEIRKRLK